MTVSNPIKWHGGKAYLADWIISIMPQHTHYVEPYFGGGAVLFRKDPSGISEVINDVNGELTNFWDVLRSETQVGQLQRLLLATPMSEVIFDRSVVAYGQGTAIDRAFNFFVRYRQSRQGLGKDFATLSRNRTRRGMNEQASSWLTAIDVLPAAHTRLKQVVVLNRNALDVISSQDGTNTLFYLDPPYLHSTRTTKSDYEFEMTESQHSDVLDVLSNLKGKFLLSGYRSKLYDDAAARNGWNRHEKVIDNKASGKKTKKTKVECIWTNSTDCKPNQGYK